MAELLEEAVERGDGIRLNWPEEGTSPDWTLSTVLRPSSMLMPNRYGGFAVSSQTSRQPWSMTRPWPRLGMVTVSVTPGSCSAW
ncbi:MAG: hypothetical protein ACJ72N_25185 [Labedaea sp.]